MNEHLGVLLGPSDSSRPGKKIRGAEGAWFAHRSLRQATRQVARLRKRRLLPESLKGDGGNGKGAPGGGRGRGRKISFPWWKGVAMETHQRETGVGKRRDGRSRHGNQARFTSSGQAMVWRPEAFRKRFDPAWAMVLRRDASPNLHPPHSLCPAGSGAMRSFRRALDIISFHGAIGKGVSSRVWGGPAQRRHFSRGRSNYVPPAPFSEWRRCTMPKQGRPSWEWPTVALRHWRCWADAARSWKSRS